MRRTGSIPLALPSFRGEPYAWLILLNVGAFFALAILSWVSGPSAAC